MPNRDDAVTLDQILSHARKALRLIKGKSRRDLTKDEVLSLALTRLLEVIGEASTRLSQEMRSAHREIPWKRIISLRNRLIHEYDQVDLDIMWVILTKDLPVFASAIQKVRHNALLKHPGTQSAW